MAPEEPAEYEEEYVETTVIWEYRSGTGDLAGGGAGGGGGSGLELHRHLLAPVRRAPAARLHHRRPTTRSMTTSPTAKPDDGIVREREVGTTTAADGSTVPLCDQS